MRIPYFSKVNLEDLIGDDVEVSTRRGSRNVFYNVDGRVFFNKRNGKYRIIYSHDVMPTISFLELDSQQVLFLGKNRFGVIGAFEIVDCIPPSVPEEEYAEMSRALAA